MSTAAMQFFWRAMRADLDVEASGHFRASGGLRVRDALQLYKSGYWIRQVEALADGLPRLFVALGEDAFAELCRQYLRAAPSNHQELERLSTGLAAFMRAHDNPRLRELAGIAHYECHVMRCFLAPTPGGVATPLQIEAARFHATRLGFVASLHVVDVEELVWAAPVEAGDGLVAQAPWPRVSERSQVTVALWRDQTFEVRRRVLSADAAAMLRLAMGGAVMARIMDGYLDDIERVHHEMQRWFTHGWIESLAVAEPNHGITQ